MLGIKCAKSETAVGSLSGAAHDPTGGGSLPGFHPDLAALDPRGKLGAHLTLGGHRRPALIILDAVPAALDGIEACRCLRRLPETRDAGILGVTGHPSMVPVLLGAGADVCVTKPLGLDVVCREIARLASAAAVSHSLTGREG